MPARDASTTSIDRGASGVSETTDSLSHRASVSSDRGASAVSDIDEYQLSVIEPRDNIVLWTELDDLCDNKKTPGRQRSFSNAFPWLCKQEMRFLSTTPW